MIEINLLPVEQRIKKKSTGGGLDSPTAKKVILGLTLVGLIFIVVTVFFYFDFKNSSKKLIKADERWTEVSPQMAGLRGLEDRVEKELIPERTFVRKYIRSGNGPITRILEGLTTLIPHNVWLKSFSLAEKEGQRNFRLMGEAIGSETESSLEKIDRYLYTLQAKLPGAKFSYSTTKKKIKNIYITAFDANFEW